MGNLKETLFVFPWEKPFGNHKMCLLMGFSGGNTTQRQQCMLRASTTLSQSRSPNLNTDHGICFTRQLSWCNVVMGPYLSSANVKNNPIG